MITGAAAVAAVQPLMSAALPQKSAACLACKRAITTAKKTEIGKCCTDCRYFRRHLLLDSGLYHLLLRAEELCWQRVM